MMRAAKRRGRVFLTRISVSTIRFSKPLREALKKMPATKSPMLATPRPRTIHEWAALMPKPMMAMAMAHMKAKRFALLAATRPKSAEARTLSMSPLVAVRAFQIALGTVMRTKATTAKASIKTCARVRMNAITKSR